MFLLCRVTQQYELGVPASMLAFLLLVLCTHGKKLTYLGLRIFNETPCCQLYLWHRNSEYSKWSNTIPWHLKTLKLLRNSITSNIFPAKHVMCIFQHLTTEMTCSHQVHKKRNIHRAHGILPVIPKSTGLYSTLAYIR